jgi:hypothetical protein
MSRFLSYVFGREEKLEETVRERGEREGGSFFFLLFFSHETQKKLNI